jgi:hypothetical protein
MLAQTTHVQRILIIGLAPATQILPNFTRHNASALREAKRRSAIEHFSFIVEYWFALVQIGSQPTARPGVRPASRSGNDVLYAGR